MFDSRDKLGDIVKYNRAFVSIFERYGWHVNDYRKTLKEICEENNLSDAFLISLLHTIDTGKFVEESKMSISCILDYLKRSHQYYLNKKIPELELSLNNILKEGINDVKIQSLAKVFTLYKSFLIKHIEEEESLLFPYINDLVTYIKSGEKIDLIADYSIEVFENGHHDIESQIRYIREKIFDLKPEEDYGLIYSQFVNLLLQFEIELNKHTYIEDEILIPKVLLLESLIHLKNVDTFYFSLN